MDYEIIATLGPSSAEDSTWTAMIDARVTGFRLNTSHCSVDQLAEWADRLGAFFTSRGVMLPVVLDLQGSKWRLGQFTPFILIEGASVRLVRAPAASEPDLLPVPHADFFRAAKAGAEVALNDAKARLRVEAVERDTVYARVVLGSEIVPKKGITIAGADLRAEALGEKDRAIFERSRVYPFIQYAISYLKDAAEMANYRAVFGSATRLTAKLERPSAMEAAAQVGAQADALWVCRGDLGAELGPRGMAEAVHGFNQHIADCPAPVLLAGQVLEHMVASPTPTRSEVYTIYDALARGYRGVVLSDEAAVGKFPVEACRAAAMFKG